MLLPITENPCKNTHRAILQSLIYVHWQGSAIKGRFYREKVKIASMLKNMQLSYQLLLPIPNAHPNGNTRLKSAQARGKSASQLMLARMLKP